MAESNQIVILGAHGTLGQQLSLLYPRALTFDRHDLDVTDEFSVRAKLSAISSLSTVINCVAFNDVDGAETKRDAAFLLNTTVPGQLAALCQELNVTFVHYSTGYVFDGTHDSYTEDDQPNPLSVYAESKAAGEAAVSQAGGHYYIIRTNVLFGPKGDSPASKPSFVDLMLSLKEKTNTLKLVEDEINSITYAPDLAAATKSLLENGGAPGIYHIVNSGYASWYGWATQIFADLGFTINQTPAAATAPDGKNITLLPVAGTEFTRPAKRPARIILQNTKLPALRPWQEALAEYLARTPGI